MGERCTVCGEPMAPEEQMFKFHGSLGSCPKPPLPRQDSARVAFRNRVASLFNIDGFVIRAAMRETGAEPLTDDQMDSFLSDPPRFFLRADQPTATAIWNCIEARQRDA